VLTAGGVLSGICLGVAIVLEVLGGTIGAGSMTDLGTVSASVLRVEPWGWATLGVLFMIATPAVALVATILEYLAANDRRTAWTAISVLAVLAVSLLIALAR